MTDREEQSADEYGYTFRGNVQTGAIGTNASATVGAIGDGARGFVTVAGHPAHERLMAQMLDLIDELRTALDEHREQIDDDLYEVVESNLDDLEESVESHGPAKKLKAKLGALQALLSPFDTLVGLVAKLMELLHKNES